MKKKIAALAIAASIGMASISAAAEVYTTKAGYFISGTKAGLERGMQCLIEKDYEALARLMLNQQVLELKAGVQVYVVKWTWDGIVEVRPRGINSTVWTVREAIEK